MTVIAGRAFRISRGFLCALALPAAGCGSTGRGPAAPADPTIPTASCVAEPLAPAPLPQEVGVYRAGPLILAAGDDLAQNPQEGPGHRTSGSDAIVVLSGDRPVVLSTDPGSRGRFSLQFTPIGRGHPSPVLSDGRPAVRFPACAGRLHRFGGGILFKGTGCARLRLERQGSPAVPMLIPIGNTLRGCSASRPMQALGDSALPSLGVSCSTPSSIACDRVGVGVHLRRPAALVVVQLAGRLVTLSPPTDPGTDLWIGYLFDGGLRHGPLKVRIAAGAHLWFGSPEVNPRVRVTAFFPGGDAATTAATVLLHPGFG